MKYIDFIGDGKEPRRSYPGDAGFDLFVSDTVYVRPGEFIDAPCDISIALPFDMWAMILGRSSTLKRRGLLVVQSVIDSGYRGPIFTGVQNLTSQIVWIEEGERLGQLIPFFLDASLVQFRRTEKLSDSDRGESSFGSTGT